MEDLPHYLLHAMLDSKRRDTVQINIRLSGEPEGTAQLNEIPLETFRDILSKTFKFAPDIVEKDIEKLNLGYSYDCPLFMTEEGLYRTGLLTRYQGG